MAHLLTDCIDQIVTITLNNPEQRNCLSNALLTELVEALAEFERRRVRAVVIRAASGITGQPELVIVGSQALLAQFPQAPAALLASMEADIYPRCRLDLARNRFRRAQSGL